MGRPVKSWHGFVGQRGIVDSIVEHCQGVLRNGRAALHMLLFGASGVGKTRLARSVATELGVACHEHYSARGMPKYKLAETLAALKAADVLFVDEAHALGADLQEALYRAISESKRPELDSEKRKVVDNGWVEMPPFTLVLATDQPGQLQNALRKRIGLQYKLDLYRDDEMRVIVKNRAAELGIELLPQAATRLAGAARGIPRRAEQILESIATVSQDAQAEITRPMVEAHLLRHFSIDRHNLDAMDRAYLRALNNRGGRMSLTSLALQIGLDADAVQRDVEPHLMRRGYVDVASGGRCLADAGRALELDGRARR